MQPGRVTTSLKRLFPPRIFNRCSNGWSQRCNGAILHYLRLISRGRDYHSIPSNFTTQLRHAFEGGAVHRPNYPLNEARTRAIYIYIYIENGKRFQSKVTPKQLFPSACPFNGGYSFFLSPPLSLSLFLFSCQARINSGTILPPCFTTDRYSLSLSLSPPSFSPTAIRHIARASRARYTRMLAKKPSASFFFFSLSGPLDRSGRVFRENGIPATRPCPLQPSRERFNPHLPTLLPSLPPFLPSFLSPAISTGQR